MTERHLIALTYSLAIAAAAAFVGGVGLVFGWAWAVLAATVPLVRAASWASTFELSEAEAEDVVDATPVDEIVADIRARHAPIPFREPLTPARHLPRGHDA